MRCPEERLHEGMQVTGLPQGRLLGKTGNPLPTHVIAAFKGALTAPLLRSSPGLSTHATARFSPDVPGAGERRPASASRSPTGSASRARAAARRT